MFIRRPRGISKGQIVFVTIIGVLGGNYIYQPILTKYNQEEKTGKEIGNPTESADQKQLIAEAKKQ